MVLAARKKIPSQLNSSEQWQTARVGKRVKQTLISVYRRHLRHLALLTVNMVGEGNV